MYFLNECITWIPLFECKNIVNAHNVLAHYTVVTFEDSLTLLQLTQGTQLGVAAIEVLYSLY